MRCITDVAEKMCIAQPSISRSFTKMRDYFKDPLVVRSGKGMILTPRALELQSILEELFATLHKLEPTSFDPASHAVEFSIAASDYFAKYILCNALTQLLEADNNLSFKILPWNKQVKTSLIQGDVHLAFSIDNDFPPNMYSTSIGQDKLVLVMSNNHPLADKQMFTYDDLMQCQFIHVKTGGGWVSRFLTQENIVYSQLKTKIEVSSFHEALILAQKTKLLTIVPLHVLRNIPNTNQLVTHDLPGKVTVEFSMWWHECHHNDLAHKWFRQTIFPLIKHEINVVTSQVKP